MANKEKTLLELLKKIAIEQKYENHEIVLKAVSSGGANYTSKIYKAVVKEENKEDLHLFAKCAVFGDSFRSQARIYDTEQYTYTSLLKLYDSLQDKYEIPAEHRLSFCKCYGVHPEKYEEMLVLEDLEARGYGSYDRFQCLNWQYSAAAVTQLAKYHALSFALSQYFPKEFDEILDKLKFIYEASSDVIMDGPIASALKTVRSDYRDSLKVFIEKYRKNMYLSAFRSVRSTVIVHGDFRANNLMHKMREVSVFDFDYIVRAGGYPTHIYEQHMVEFNEQIRSSVTTFPIIRS